LFNQETGKAIPTAPAFCFRSLLLAQNLEAKNWKPKTDDSVKQQKGNRSSYRKTGISFLMWIPCDLKQLDGVSAPPINCMQVKITVLIPIAPTYR